MNNKEKFKLAVSYYGWVEDRASEVVEELVKEGIFPPIYENCGIEHFEEEINYSTVIMTGYSKNGNIIGFSLPGYLFEGTVAKSTKKYIEFYNSEHKEAELKQENLRIQYKELRKQFGPKADKPIVKKKK